MARIRFNHLSARCYLAELDEGLWAVVNVYSTERRQGHATGLMQDVIRWADKHKVRLNLMVMSYDGKNHNIPDNHDLEAFYAKFGFERMGNVRPIFLSRIPSHE